MCESEFAMSGGGVFVWWPRLVFLGYVMFVYLTLALSKKRRSSRTPIRSDMIPAAPIHSTLTQLNCENNKKQKNEEKAEEDEKQSKELKKFFTRPRK